MTYLIRKVLPAPAILLATGLSKRMVKKYTELHEKHSGPDFSSRMGRILAIARAHPSKKARTTLVRGGEWMKRDL